MSLSKAIAKFVIGLDDDSMPPDVLEKVRACLLNAYGIALCATTTPYADVARRAVLSMEGGMGRATLLLGRGQASVAGAAFANAALFHGRVQDDTCGAAHFGATLVPLLTAMIEAHGLPTSRLLLSLVAGYEVGGLLEQAFSSQTTASGLRASPLYGSVAAAAAAAKLMSLNEAQTWAAVSNAASFTGGMLQSFEDGSDEWRYQLGVAAQLGYTAAQLAAAGSSSAALAFEGRCGFIPTFARLPGDAQELIQRLGRDWSLRRVTFKPYPVCAFNQTPVTAALELRTHLRAIELLNLNVHMHPYEADYAGMDCKGPFTSLSATLMSAPFCVASALVHGGLTMRSMTAYDDPPVTQLLQRIRLIPDANVARLSCRLEATLNGGRQIVHRRDMSVSNYSYDRAGVSALIRRIAAESRVSTGVVQRLEEFADDPARFPISAVLTCFETGAEPLDDEINETA